MRLINCSTLQLEDFFDLNIPRYAILSHTWGSEEVTFADFTLNEAVAIAKEGYKKIHAACKQALRDGLNYAWVDTCCIDKTSSAELSEAINSMFRWYSRSDICYAYLADVPIAEFERSFPKSKWFTRGWTLQELLAPQAVEFFDREWNKLGTRSTHAQRISEITAIEEEALVGFMIRNDYVRDLSRFCVAKKMSWASCRKTTRLEDTAYCLLGIFDINMPLLYGEGDRAFMRLQEEIIRTIVDDSILAWNLDTSTHYPVDLAPIFVETSPSKAILAASPGDFKNCGDVQYNGSPNSTLTMTKLGLQIRLPLVRVMEPPWKDPSSYRPRRERWIGLLKCSLQSESRLLGITLAVVGISDSRQEMERTQTEHADGVRSTVVVGPRAAAQSDLKDITIIRDYDSMARQPGTDQRLSYIIVNESEALAGTGYYIASGIGLHHARVGSLRPGAVLTWDPAAKLLIVPRDYIDNVLLSLQLSATSNRKDSDYTIFVQAAYKRAILRRGTRFSAEEEDGFYRELCSTIPKSMRDADAMQVTSLNSEGVSFEVVVTVTHTMVDDWQIFNVTIDAVQRLRRVPFIRPGEGNGKGKGRMWSLSKNS